VSEGGVVSEGQGRRPATSLRELADAISRRRQLTALALGAILLPAMTVVLTAVRPDLDLDDDLLLYLVLVMAVTLLGGFWPAVAAAVAGSLLLNWFFTPPLHNWTIDSPQNLTALLLFITVAVTASSVVHLAARRAAVARRSQAETDTLLELAQTVLGGRDTAGDVLRHLAQDQLVAAELQERTGGRWVRVAAAGEIDADDRVTVLRVRDDLRLRVVGHPYDGHASRTIDGYAAQAAAALDRERLRTQAAQAEILGAGNRMRTALLAAVSHDLRTPLAAVKASASALRQTDVAWTPEDEAELLATIEQNADRLDELIANLLDMSRIQTGALQPLLRPVSIEEIAPLALRGLEGSPVVLDIPEGLPLIATDPGLLERAVANLVSNALRYSPPDRPTELQARDAGATLVLDVVDHGPGVAPGDRDGMFLPFQQLGDQRNAGGVGLGLAVARGFVESVGGTLTAHNTRGGGLTMRIELPVTAAVTDDAPATP
jgi:two-component system, OmpR family, sensor histidine kinase KdpD